MNHETRNEEESQRYRAYLLRLWCDGEERAWHASLQRSTNAEPLSFADLDELFAYLVRITEKRKAMDNEQ